MHFKALIFLRVFLLICAFSPALSHADDTTAQSFRQEAASIPKALLANGDADIQVNRQLWTNTPGTLRAVISVHEHLGPSGINDQDYQVSTALALLASTEADSFTPDEKESFTAKINPAAHSGGIVGISGGGDENGADTKMLMLHRDLGRLARENNPGKRKAIMANVRADLTIRSEVSRQNADDHGLIFRTAPSEIADSTRYANVCQHVLRIPADQFENVFQSLAKQNPELRRKVPDSGALRTWCNGFLDGSVQ
jgi:hypothetical protein